MKSAISLIFCIICLTYYSGSCAAQIIALEGYVRDVKGNPIKDVNISVFGKTDEKGHFLLKSDVFLKYWKALLFTAPGYRPHPVQLDASKLKFDVIMEAENHVETLTFPACGGDVPKGTRRIGEWVKLTIPKSFKFKTGIDTDYRYFNIGFGKGSEQKWMRGGLGPMYTGVNPSPNDILNLSTYSYRKTSTGSDWTGITKDGHYWRYMGSVAVFETYHYETDLKSASDAFDAILDSACFQDHPDSYELEK